MNIPPEQSEQPEFGFEANPNGPWAKLRDPTLKDVLLENAAESFGVYQQNNPNGKRDLAGFLDLYTCAWLEFKGRVEDEAQKYGFQPCENLQHVPAADRPKVAILALTLSGSFLLLGNGCLTPSGGSGRYEKIPFRVGGTSEKKLYTPSGVSCRTEPEVGKQLFLTQLVNSTSYLYHLYYTTDSIGSQNELQLAESIRSFRSDMATSFAGGFDETIIDVPMRRERQPEPMKV